MTRERLTLGRWGEDVAARYLQKKGMKILWSQCKIASGGAGYRGATWANARFCRGKDP